MTLIEHIRECPHKYWTWSLRSCWWVGLYDDSDALDTILANHKKMRQLDNLWEKL